MCSWAYKYADGAYFMGFSKFSILVPNRDFSEFFFPTARKLLAASILHDWGATRFPENKNVLSVKDTVLFFTLFEMRKMKNFELRWSISKNSRKFRRLKIAPMVTHYDSLLLLKYEQIPPKSYREPTVLKKCRFWRACPIK